MIRDEYSLEKLKKSAEKETKGIEELVSFLKSLSSEKSGEEKRMLNSQINNLKISLEKTGKNVVKILNRIKLEKRSGKKSRSKLKKPKSLTDFKTATVKKSVKKIPEKLSFLRLEKETLARLKKKREEAAVEKVKKPSRYIKTSSKMFFDFSCSLTKKGMFKTLKKDLTKSNLQFIPENYISVIFFTAFLSFAASLFLFIFLMFFEISAVFPIISLAAESFLIRALKFIWILPVIPAGVFFGMYIYPSLEKKYSEAKINQELPFATINMSAISGSMIDPTKIFSIIISTKEYPFIEKEFTKLINEINIYGYDLVSALRRAALNSPSLKLGELFNSLATTINSGGNLPGFFAKRAENLLFDYRLEREKATKSAETFMDIYISVVIAAPMMLMLLLMMMKISGLGISLSTGMISLIMVLGVAIVNFVFIAFLHLKQPAG